VARGLAPVRLRSSRKLGKCGVVKYALGPLRDPTGASPLATKALPFTEPTKRPSTSQRAFEK
jgi:hypothetical protein